MIKEDDDLLDPRRYKVIEDALNVLSEREREVYKMSRGEGFSFQEIAEMLGISRGSIDTLIHQAERKLEVYKNQLTASSLL